MSAWILAVVCAATSLADERAGELRLIVSDASGARLQASGKLLNHGSRFMLELKTNAEGEYTARKLPFGTYELVIERAGFARLDTLVTIRSEIPVRLAAVLRVTSRAESITVNDGATTVLDTTNTGTAYVIGKAALQKRLSSSPGRELIDVVQAQPGWIVEANGVLHPRGSEYETQHVIDGIPTLDNRSPAFALGRDIEDVQSVKVYTSGIPAEFGRKLGGVIETVSERNPPQGLHGSALLGGGSFNTQNGYLGASYVGGRTAFAMSGSGSHTDRYLDPPVQENYTNSGTTTALTTSVERDLTQKDRLRLTLRHEQA
ncbi:MAG: TonB-dependent receptor, partial [Acidobacteriia bacterium]|nr:TonB-dependent receptor [Terriglobia bacterium]